MTAPTVSPQSCWPTARLLLRPWQDSDREPFAALNADPEVMRYFPSPLSRAQSDAMVDRIQQRMAEQGWGLWAVQRQDTAAFIGFVGLARPNAELPFAPCVEVGWRLARAHWHQGFATEAAREALRIGFECLHLPEIVSFTAAINQPSRAVMERLGMVNRGEDFDHPAVPEGSPLRGHVLYQASGLAVGPMTDG